MKTESVKVELSSEELDKIAEKLAAGEKDLSDAEGRLETAATAWKATSKALKAEISTCRTEVHDLARIYRDGAETREVEVDERVVDGIVQTFRVDTGATLRSRPLETGDQLTINDSESDDDESSIEEI